MSCVRNDHSLFQVLWVEVYSRIVIIKLMLSFTIKLGRITQVAKQQCKEAAAD
jgi:hypothetical protein